MMFFDPLYFIILAPAMLLALVAQLWVKGAYARASRIRAAGSITGADAAEMILHAHDIHNVRIEPSHGFLTDHYDPKAKVIRLSPDVLRGQSVAALGIAAHEAGHAVQDKVRYGPLAIRNGIVPLAGIGSNFGFLLIFVGIVMGGAANALGNILVWAGILLFGAVVVFQLVNLPVEFDASRRAKKVLTESGLIASGPQAAAMNGVLNAAALTYVAATLTAILTLVYFLLRSGILGRRD